MKKAQILTSLIFLFLLSKIMLKREKISILPRRRGLESSSVKRHLIENLYLEILMVMSPMYTFNGSFLSPYVLSCLQEDKSTPVSSAIYLGRTVQSAPVSKINSNGRNPSLVKTSTIITGSDTSPRVVSFLSKGNSIDTSGSFWRDASNHYIFSMWDMVFLKQDKEAFHRWRTGNDFVIAPGDEFTAKFILKLHMSFCMHIFHLLNKDCHITKNKSRELSG